MKNKFLFALLIALCALLLTACSIDLPIPGIPTPGDGPTPGSDQTPMTLGDAYEKARWLGFSAAMEDFALLIGMDSTADGNEISNVTAITLNEDGKMLITMSDGTTLDPIDLSPKPEHIHTYGEWQSDTGNDELACDERLFYRTCTSCPAREERNGTYSDHTFTTTTTPPTCSAEGYDTKTCTACGLTQTVNPTGKLEHDFQSEYSHDTIYHWYACNDCDAKDAYAEHTPDAMGLCTVCHKLVPTQGVRYNVQKNATYAEVVGYEGAHTHVVIADTYNGLPVTRIAPNAFKNASMTSVLIPDAVMSIGSNAFESCENLTGVTIPASVTSIGDSAFRSCSSLTSVTFAPNGSLRSIGASAFAKCNLSTVTLPASLQSMKASAFSRNPLLAIQVAPENETFTSLDGNLYSKDTKTLLLYAIGKADTTFTVPDGVTAIGESAFSYGTSLTAIVLPESLTAIGNSAFSNCTLLEAITIPASVTSIGDSAFYKCIMLSSVTPAQNGSLRTIGASAFSGCTSLTAIALPNSLTAIGTGAFTDCTKLTTVELSERSLLTSIGSQAFYNCNSLAQIYIPVGVASLGSGAFYECDRLVSVTFAQGISLTEIPQEAFAYCYSLSHITIPSTVQSIGRKAFIKADFSTLTLPDSVRTVGDYAFMSCNELISITLNEGITSIGEHAFGYCQQLTQIQIPASVETLGAYAFEYCVALERVSFAAQSNLHTIGSYAFYRCYKLDTFTVCASVSSIGRYAFMGCGLTSVVFEAPDGWRIASASDLADAAKAATYLTFTFLQNDWSRQSA